MKLRLKMIYLIAIFMLSDCTLSNNREIKHEIFNIKVKNEYGGSLSNLIVRFVDSDNPDDFIYDDYYFTHGYTAINATNKITNLQTYDFGNISATWARYTRSNHDNSYFVWFHISDSYIDDIRLSFSDREFINKNTNDIFIVIQRILVTTITSGSGNQPITTNIKTNVIYYINGEIY